MELADQQVFQQFVYDGPIPRTCTADLTCTVRRPGRLNAVRIVTKNILAAHLLPPSTVDWLMNYLVVPLPETVVVDAGDRVRITFDYCPGDELQVLMASVRGRVV